MDSMLPVKKKYLSVHKSLTSTDLVILLASLSMNFNVLIMFE